MKFVVHRLQTILTQLFKGFRFVKPFPSYTSIKFWGVAYNDSMANILFCKKWPHTLDTHDGAAVWFTSMTWSCMQLTSRVPWQIWERSSVPSTKLAGHLFQRDTVFLGQLNVQLFQCAQGAAQQPSKGWRVQPGLLAARHQKDSEYPMRPQGDGLVELLYCSLATQLAILTSCQQRGWGSPEASLWHPVLRGRLIHGRTGMGVLPQEKKRQCHQSWQVSRSRQLNCLMLYTESIW